MKAEIMDHVQLAQALQIAEKLMNMPVVEKQEPFTNDPARMVQLDKYDPYRNHGVQRLYLGTPTELKEESQAATGFRYFIKYENWNPFVNADDWSGILKHFSDQDASISLSWRGKDDCICNIYVLVMYEGKASNIYVPVIADGKAPTPGEAVVNACIKFIDARKAEQDRRAAE